MDSNAEKEMCNNCKKEIPQQNYVMHTMHCARNITLCKVCNEPIPKIEYENHRERCRKPVIVKSSPPPTAIENSSYFQQRKAIEDQKAANRRENYLRKHEHLLDKGFKLNETVRNGYGGSSSRFSVTPGLTHSTSLSSASLSSSSNLSSVSSNSNNSSTNNSQQSSVTSGTTNSSSGAVKKPPLIPRLDDSPRPKGPQGLLPCQYCELELPKLDLEEHENYCGSRTDKCLECGELVMFKNKQSHWDSNHGFAKLRDQPSPQPSWDSTTQRTESSIRRSASDIETSPSARRRPERFRFADVDYDPMPYLPAAYQPGGGLRKNKEGESYKEISRRLDSSSPQLPRRRRNPPTELSIPCEFCDTPIPHEELIQHETGCRPDLARFNPRRSRTQIPLADEDDYTPAYEAPRMRTPPRADSPDAEELPCEFCSHMVPASQLWRHQLSCTSAA